MTALHAQPTEAALDALATDLDGTLTRPGDPTWDAARQAWHLELDQRPLAVVQAGSVRDVVTTVNAARAMGVRVAPQSTGHNAAPLGDLGEAILLKTAALNAVTIDPVRRIARVEAGAWWAHVTQAAAEHGLAALAGSSPDVGVAGYTLGGGLSWLARSHGLAANSVTALDVVTADGILRRVDEQHEAELFWALRGGGGSFGVVTALELRLYPITEVHAGTLFFPAERAAEVLHAWRAWLPSVPESVTTVGRILQFPPLPDLPPMLAGHSFVVVEACCQLDQEDADRLLAALRELGPVMDTFATIPITELQHLHRDPPGPVPGFGDGALLGKLTPAAIEAFVSAVLPGPLLSAELRQLGGALAPGRQSGGAVDSLDAEFALFAVGMTPSEEAHHAVRTAVAAVQYAVSGWSTGDHYANFSESPKPGQRLFGHRTWDQLRGIKTVYDPTDLIKANHPVPPLER